MLLTGGNRNDVTQLIPLLQAVPPIRGRRGRPRQRAPKAYADRGYDHGSGLGKPRRSPSKPFALPHCFRRLRIRWEIRYDIHEALLNSAAPSSAEAASASQSARSS